VISLSLVCGYQRIKRISCLHLQGATKLLVTSDMQKLIILVHKLRGLSPQANYTDRATAAVGEVVPTFADRECYVVSATDSHGR
jgi:hypothetical protein